MNRFFNSLVCLVSIGVSVQWIVVSFPRAIFILDLTWLDPISECGATLILRVRPKSWTQNFLFQRKVFLSKTFRVWVSWPAGPTWYMRKCTATTVGPTDNLQTHTFHFHFKNWLKSMNFGVLGRHTNKCKRPRKRWKYLPLCIQRSQCNCSKLSEM